MWSQRDSPFAGCFSLKTTHFRLHCTGEAVEGESHRVALGTQKAGSEEAGGVRGPPSPGPNGRSRCPVAPGCAPSAARPSSSSPWLLAGSCHRSRIARPWRLRRPSGGPAPGPSGRRGCGCGAPAGRRRPLFLHLPVGYRASSHGACGRPGSDRSRCGRYCSTRHRSYGEQEERFNPREKSR